MECSFRELGYCFNGGCAEQLHFDGINLAWIAVATIEARRDACRCGYAAGAMPCRKLFVDEASFAECIAAAP